MKKNIIKYTGLILSALLLISGVLVLTGCEDTLMPLIEEEVRLAENNIVFLTVSTTGLGSTIPEGTVEAVASIPFPISASAGTDYMFYNWTSNDSGVVFDDIYSEDTNVTLNSGNATVTANFVTGDLIHTLLINTNNSLWGTTNPTGTNSVINDLSYTIVAASATGYHFTNWTVSSGPATITDVNAASTTVKVVNPTSAGAVIQADFALNTYNLDVQQDSEGVSGETGDATAFNDGASLPIDAGNPIDGAIFTYWSVVSGSGSIVFDDETLANTNVTITGGTHDETIIIQANFSRLLFIAGYEENGSAVKTACYWAYVTETGTINKTVLGNGTDISEATSISLFGKVVYIGGWEGSNGYYWTHTNNGAGTLTKNAITGYDNDYNGKVHSIYVNPDEDIYLAGEHYSTPTSWNPNLSGQAYLHGGYGAAFDLFFNEGSYDYFVSGYIDLTIDKAVYWINPDGLTPDGIALTDGTLNAAATSIFQRGTTIYIGGWEGLNGYYWTHTNNGAGTLTKNAITGYNNDYNGKVHSIYVTGGGDIYLAGEHYSTPTCWNPNVSGQAYLEGGNGAALDLFYIEGSSEEFFVAGYIDGTKDQAVIWITPDGTSPANVDLTNGTYNARANAIISY